MDWHIAKTCALDDTLAAHRGRSTCWWLTPRRPADHSRAATDQAASSGSTGERLHYYWTTGAEEAKKWAGLFRWWGRAGWRLASLRLPSSWRPAQGAAGVPLCYGQTGMADAATAGSPPHQMTDVLAGFHRRTALHFRCSVPHLPRSTIWPGDAGPRAP